MANSSTTSYPTALDALDSNPSSSDRSDAAIDGLHPHSGRAIRLESDEDESLAVW